MTQLTNYSETVGTTPVQIFPQQAPGLVFMRIWNVSPVGGPTIWLTRYGSTPAANAPGSFSLAPGEFEEFSTIPFVMTPPTNSLWAVATGAGAALTVEVG